MVIILTKINKQKTNPAACVAFNFNPTLLDEDNCELLAQTSDEASEQTSGQTATLVANSGWVVYEQSDD
jgi:hypothetical protein